MDRQPVPSKKWEEEEGKEVATNKQSQHLSSKRKAAEISKTKANMHKKKENIEDQG